jgi:probable rRNA maturation factor
VNVLIADETNDVDGTGELLEMAVMVLERERVPEDSEVAIVLVDVATMTLLNERHRGKDGPTDVLSFPLEDAEPGFPPVRLPGGPPIHLGDIFIAPSVVRENAATNGVSFEEELALVTVHGLLHLLGWDHEVQEEAEFMEAREREYLAVAGRAGP